MPARVIEGSALTHSVSPPAALAIRRYTAIATGMMRVVTTPADAALGGLGFSAFAATGLAFGYFVQGYRWSGEARPSAIMRHTYSGWVSKVGIGFWCVCIAAGLLVAVGGGVAALVT